MVLIDINVDGGSGGKTLSGGCECLWWLWECSVAPFKEVEKKTRKEVTDFSKR